MGKHLKTLLGIIVLSGLILSSGFSPSSQQVVQALAACLDSTPLTGGYTVTVCLTNPADGSVLQGNTTVSGTVSVSGTNPGVQSLVFYLGGNYLLMDYQSPYTFTLPTADFVDGSTSLAVEASLRDGFVSGQASVQVSLANGVTTPPVNTRQFTPAAGTAPKPGSPLVVGVVGDGAGGETNAASVTSLVASWNPNLFLYLGDVYEKGSPTEFFNYYGSGTQYFGRFRSITNPTIGNHEYENGVAPGYFDYWDNVPNYYSFNAGGWHFISLNANSIYGGNRAGREQYQWLAQDLAANQAACTIVYWHPPLFNIGKEPPATWMQASWTLMAQAKVDLLLTGHDHTYQRWLPLDANGLPATGGITEFVVGTGGHGILGFVTNDQRVVAGYDSATTPKPYGALRLKLYPDHAVYDFITISGTVLDTGSLQCNKAPTGGPTPTPIPSLTLAPSPTPTQTQVPTRAPTATPTMLPTATARPTQTPIPPAGTGKPVRIYLPQVISRR